MGRLVLWAVPIVVVVVMAAAKRWTFDDGFIYFRTVDQILAGNGPVFNAGERVESFTSPALDGFAHDGRHRQPFAPGVHGGNAVDRMHGRRDVAGDPRICSSGQLRSNNVRQNSSSVGIGDLRCPVACLGVGHKWARGGTDLRVDRRLSLRAGQVGD